MRKINLGILGAGICANTFHLPALAQLSDRFNLIAVAGSNEDQNQSFAKQAGISKTFTDYNQLIEDDEVEAVISSYPYFLNRDVIMATKAAGKHILVEKPIAETMEKAKEIVSIDDGSLVLGVAENWIYWSVIDVIREQIDAGAIGTPVTTQLYAYYHMDFDDQYIKGNAWRKKIPGAMILDRTIHAVALMRELFGPVARTTGTTSIIRNELGAVDTTSVIFEYENGIKASALSCASAMGIQLPFSLAIIGTKGTITVSDFMTKVKINNASGTTELTADNGDGGYYAEFVDFHNAIVNGTEFRSDLKKAYNDLFTLLAPLENPGVWNTYDLDAISAK